jgi:hypothetical protein
MEYIETPKKQINIQHKKGTTKVNVTINKPTAQDIYNTAKEHHKQEVKALKQSIKRHKLLMKQAKTVYKLSKLAA